MYDKLKSVMAERHITGYALAKMADIGNSNLYRALNGKTEMFHGWKVRIADALETTVEDLFPEKDGEKNE